MTNRRETARPVRGITEAGLGNTTTLLAPMALERARVVAPFVLGGMVMAICTSELVGVPLPFPVVAYNAVAIPLFALLVLALRLRWFAPARGHLCLAAVWAFPIVGTLMSLLMTDDAVLTYMLTIELAAGCLMFDARILLSGFIVVDIIWVVGLTDRPHAPLFAGVIFASEVIGLLFQHLFRSQIIAAETHRAFVEHAAGQLSRQLTELQRSEQERVNLQEQLVHAQRMEAVGTLSAGLAHDMNNILGSIVSFAELAREDVISPSVRDDLGRILAQATRGAELTRSLLAFSRRGQYRKQVLELGGAIRTLVPMLSRTLPKTIELHTVIAPGTANVEGDPAQLDQVIVNLAMNATDAMGGIGTLTIATHIEGDTLRIDVSDNGIGMDEATRMRVFEPFFTTKPIGKGTGLGLATVWGIVTGHGGTIEVRSKVGVGTTFSVRLPLSDDAPSSTFTLAAPAPVSTQACILVVDDEPLVRSGTRRILERKGYTVVEASNGEEALDVFAANDGIRLVVLDMSMPVMGGPECFERLREKSDVPVLITTGHTTDAAAQKLVSCGAAFLEKPFASADLAREAGRLIAARTPAEKLAV